MRDILTRLIDTEKKEVVLLLHSYAGIPGVGATEDLGRKERYAKDLDGGIMRLVLIAAFAMSEGFGPTDEGGKMPEWMKFDFGVRPTLNLPNNCALLSAAFSKPSNTIPIIAELLGLILSISQKGIVTVDPEDAKKILYNDISPDEQDKWASDLIHQSLGVYSSKQTYSVWLHVPSTYIGGGQDKTVSMLDIVESIEEAMERMETVTFDRIEFRAGGHCFMISQLQWLFELLRKVAEHNPVEGIWAQACET